MEIGIYSFGETSVDESGRRQVGARQRLENLLDEIQLADEVGLDVFGVGEHHRPDYAVSAPAIVLAAAAARTSRIRLTSAVSVLGSEDPIRVFQDFSTIDLISGGRAEIMVGRGSFTESFPLFGQDLSEYDLLFQEKLELLLRARESDHLTWKGSHRSPVRDRGVFPRPLQDPLPIWIAVGGTPQSVVRAGSLGLPISLAIIGGTAARFQPVVELYRRAAARAGHDPSTLPVAISSHGFLAEDGERAADLAYPPTATVMNRIGRERGWPPIDRAHFEGERALAGALFVGDVDQVAEKILYQHRLFGHQRFLLQLTVGPMPHEEVLRAIELLGSRVAPVVRKALG
jgi:probable LLM family oxidoreductase